MNHPNYKHRTFVGLSDNPEDFNDNDLADFVNQSVDQIEAIVLQMQGQYELEEKKALPDSYNFSTLEVVRKELLDISTTVSWYFDKTKAGVSHE